MKLSLVNKTKTVIKTIKPTERQRSEENIISCSEKEDFFRHGKIPKSRSEKLSTEPFRRKTHKVSLEFLTEAKRILDIVNEKYHSGDTYLDEVFGPQISQDEATKYLIHYLQSEGLEGALKIIWSSDIDCCGRIIWTGPCAHLNKPEKRRYRLWLKNTPENVYLRQQGIKGLADHEIGTHYLRTLNDGFQPWFSNRRLFGLRSLNSKHLRTTEEGLAAINTLLQLKCRLLWWPAFLYYTACMSIQMSFKELFDHLVLYIRDPDQRWKHVLRVKRDLEDCSGYGGSGKDQVYFTGAVKLLREAKETDFRLLYSGKLCIDELNRVKRVRRRSIKLPHFMHEFPEYRHALREMCFVNCLEPPTIMHYVYGDVTLQDRMATARRNKLRTRKSQPSTKLKPKVCDDMRKGRKDGAEFICCEVIPIKSRSKTLCIK
ncbi:uncharacterized protein KIAA0895-like [Dendronephthya gigantea]|uniref:uncharacterized protein KIAA0895-like n=1 Tax=Dendronephthya gigantea TaxID=151771 RepID=UPI0010696511|nr:uncharacterized protein KIAA0895-like [Dendronephthya gigantea]